MGLGPSLFCRKTVFFRHFVLYLFYYETFCMFDPGPAGPERAGPGPQLHGAHRFRRKHVPGMRPGQLRRRRPPLVYRRGHRPVRFRGSGHHPGRRGDNRTEPFRQLPSGQAHRCHGGDGGGAAGPAGRKPFSHHPGARRGHRRSRLCLRRLFLRCRLHLFLRRLRSRWSAGVCPPLEGGNLNPRNQQ